MTDIIAAGHICLDILPGMNHVPLSAIASPGKLFEVDALALATGGSVSNTGQTLHRLGVDVSLMGTVGDDLLGRVIIASVRDIETRLGDSLKVKAGQSSSYSVVLSPENSDRIFLHCTGTNDTFGVDDIDFDAVSQAKIFHLGYPPLLPRLYADDGAEMIAIYKRVHESGVITSLDMAMPDLNGPSGNVQWDRILEKALSAVDIFLPSIEEIVMMLRRDDYLAWDGDVMSHINRTYLDAMADDLLAMGAGVVAFKLGELGFYSCTTSDTSRLSTLNTLLDDVSTWTDQRVYHPAFEVNMVGTTGAGDAACGGFLTALLHGLSLSEATRYACAVGGCACEAADSIGGVQTWQATQSRLSAGWQTLAHTLPDT